jgi:DNA-binding response OmpR family regulator
MRVLIADDDLVVRRLVECFVRGAGHDVVLAADGHEALAILQGDDPPQVALVDWMMPGHDGLELCRIVRSASPPAPIYVILLTGRDSPADIAAGFESGANDYVTKPIKKEQLLPRLAVATRTSAWESNPQRPG